jgi:broad specificity phosphatase PhoE
VDLAGQSLNCSQFHTLHMSDTLPIVYLARHGETTWTISGQHTGLSDLPLTERGERNALRLGQRLKGLAFTAVLSSPLQRVTRTCELAGFGSVAQVEPNLVEWNQHTLAESAIRLTMPTTWATNAPRLSTKRNQSC